MALENLAHVRMQQILMSCCQQVSKAFSIGAAHGERTISRMLNS